jgi:hypothetical protein
MSCLMDSSNQKSREVGLGEELPDVSSTCVPISICRALFSTSRRLFTSFKFMKFAIPIFPTLLVHRDIS